MEACAFGIESELLHVGYLIEKAIYLAWPVDVESALRFGRRHHPNLVI